jgi:hypothetical protein
LEINSEPFSLCPGAPLRASSVFQKLAELKKYELHAAVMSEKIFGNNRICQIQINVFTQVME